MSAQSTLRHFNQAQLEYNAALRTLLYVEDKPANLKLVTQLIARRPNLCLPQCGGRDARIELARDRQPAVILMDINLPGISGIGALKILREDPLTQPSQSLPFSANAMPHDIHKGLEGRLLFAISPSPSGSSSSWKWLTWRWILQNGNRAVQLGKGAS